MGSRGFGLRVAEQPVNSQRALIGLPHYMWVVVEIRVPFLVPIMIGHLLSIVEARKLEHHYPRALKVKYRESQQESSKINVPTF